MSKATSVSEHYLSEAGEKYYNRYNRDIADYKFGRIIQSEYFRPYADKEKVLLDFGCSDGLFLRHLSAKERIGVEVNPTAREKCKDLSEEENIPVELHESLQTINENRADVVISNHALEHVLNPYEILQEIHRILKPNGVFVVCVPFDDWRSQSHDKWRKNNPDNHLYTWSPLNLGNLLTEAGFSVLKTKLCTKAWSPKIFWIHKLFGKKVFDMACRLLSFVKNRREILCVAEKPQATFLPR